MRLQLRLCVILFLLFFSFFSWGQTAERSVPAGTSAYPETQSTDPAARSGPPQSPQNGNGTLGNMYSNTACGLNFTSASQRIGQRFSPAGVAQPAPFAISGIPACATVVKAFLWAEGSGNGAAQTATVSGPFGSANYPMAIVGQGPDKCWSYSGSYTYRADVTPTIGGNGTYNISGLLTNPPTSSNDMDGATLMVIYTDPTQTYQGTILIDDGAMVSPGGTISYDMNYTAVCGTATNAQAFCAIGDLQMAVGSLSLNGTATPVTWNWWNYCQTATTVSTGQSTSNFSITSTGDCYNLCFTGLYYRTTCVACSVTPLTLNMSSTGASCSACNGTATVSASPAGSYTYSWAPSGGTGATASGLCAGTYTVTVTSSCGTSTATVVVPSIGGSLTLASAGQTNVSCNGGCNGTATVSVTTGTGPFTYSWSPSGGTGATASGLCAGNYTCTVTDPGGCTGTQTFSITQPPALTATQSQTNVSCNGGCNGTATVSASGGNPGYTYAWSPSGGTGATASSLCAGTYTCTITDANACFITKIFSITQPPALTATQSQVNVSCNGGCNGTATVAASGGTGPYTYSWTPSGGTGTTASSLCAGTYTCTITDANACFITKTFTITQPPALTATQSQVNVSCNGGCNGTATVSASGGTGPYTYAWTPSGGTGLTASSLCAATYTCTITDANTCFITNTFNITQPSAISILPSQVNVSCNGGTNGSATVVASGGTPGYTYAWTPSGGTGAGATNLAAGNYICTITDANSCTATQSFTITQPTALTATGSSSPATCGNPNGSATVIPSGGTVPYTYSWSPSGGNAATATGLPAGVYTCLITDANSCTFTQTVTVSNAGSPTAVISSPTNVLCNGGNTGSATVTASGGTGPYTYAWSPSGGNAATASGLTAGSYTVTVTDANLCTSSASVTLTEPTAISASATSTPVLCNGGSTGTATVVTSGGVGPYTYSWAPSGGTGATTSGRPAGNYTVTITDANACTATASTVITQPTAVTATQSQVNILCNGGTNGSATVTASGGTPGYTYSWAPSGGNAATATGLSAGNYTCTITDANGCSITPSFTITEPAVLTASATSVSATCGNANGSASVIASGGTAPYSYAWSPSGGNAATASGLPAGAYSCLITDANSCTFTQTVTVANAGSPTAAISSSTNVSCFGGNNGAATVTASGGTVPYTYAWTPSGGTGATGTALTAGNYTVTVSDANACTAIATVTITEPPLLSAGASFTPVLCNGGSTGTATVLASGGVTAYTYSWSPIGGTGTTAANLPAGSYTATVTDANGCTTTASTTVTEPSALTATSSQVDELCNGGATASATVTPSGATSPYTYAWSPSGGNAASASALTAGAYTCLITDANNCTFTASLTITQPSAISLTTSSVQSTCGNANGQASVVATGGTGAYTYTWAPSGGNAATATGLSATTYTVTVTDANLCSATATVTVTNAGSPTAAITSSNNVSCFGGNNGDATVTPGAGTLPYTFAWSPSGGTGATGTALIAGSYTVTVSDANGCTAVDSVLITEPSQLTASVSFTPVLCNAGSTGTATVLASGGIASYSYAWTPIGGTNPTAMNLPAGNYSCTITDANGCTTTASTTVTEPSALTVTGSQVDELCNGGATASATVTPAGATVPYTYAWSPSGGNAASASALTAGSYTCTITDANGCSMTQSFTITEPSAVVVSATETDAHCNQQDGNASATASGGTGTITFNWSLPFSGPSINNVAAGTYTVIATDANGCTGSTTTTINNLNGVNASLVSVTNVACFGQSTGQVVVTQTGGNPQYIYNWTPNVTANDTALNLPAGNYQVTVVDADGCTSTVTATVTQAPLLTISAAAIPGSVCTGTSVTMNATTAGGSPTLNVVWMPGNLSGNSQTIVPSSSGTYTATVTDANGCTATASTSVTLFPMPVPALAADSLSGCAPVCVNFSDLSTVTAPASITFWNWDFGDGNTSNQQNPSHCYANAGTYSVVLTVKSSDGCTQTVTMSNYITVFANPVAAFGASPQPTSLVNPQIFFSDSSTNAVSWNWSFGDLLNSSSTLQNPSFVYPDATCYQATLMVTSPDGCTDITSREVCIAPDVTIYVPNAFTPNGDNKNETFYPSGTGLDASQFEMWIFDRWGNMIYDTKDLSKGWDGRVQGHPDIAQEDTYVWRIRVKDLTGAEHDLLGKVTLIK